MRSGTSSPLSSVACSGPQGCVAVGDGGTILQSADGGSRWDRVGFQHDVLNGVSCGGVGQCAAVTSNAEQVLQTQGGVIWTNAFVPPGSLLPLVPMNAVSCSATTCTSVGGSGLIAQSTDGGQTWTFVYPSVTSNELFGVDCPTAALCVAVGFGGTIVVSDDGGNTWTTEPAPTRQTLLGVTCSNPLDCIAVGDGGTVLRSTDGGRQWAVQAGQPAPGSPLTVLAVGDSFAHTLAQYVGRDASSWGVSLVDGGLDGCDLARGSDLGNPGGKLGVIQQGNGPCASTGPGWEAVYQGDVAQDHPALSLLVVGPWDLSTRLIDGQWLSPGQAAYDSYYRSQLVAAIHILTSAGGRVAVTTAPYVAGERTEACAPAPVKVRNCPSQGARVAALDQVVRQVVGQFPGQATVIDVGHRLAPKDRYTVVIDGVTVRAADGVHLSEPGGEWLPPWLLPQLVAAADD